MKLYTVLYHSDLGDSFNIGVFSTFKLAEQELEIFVGSDGYVESDREKYSEDECRIYYDDKNGVPQSFADISLFTLDEFTY